MAFPFVTAQHVISLTFEVTFEVSGRFKEEVKVQKCCAISKFFNVRAPTSDGLPFWHELF